jgi:hypothetical protein
MWEYNGKALYMNNTNYLVMINKVLSEQIIRGDGKNLNISSILVRSIEESEKKVFEIPILNHSKIKEKIFESYIKGKIAK